MYPNVSTLSEAEKGGPITLLNARAAELDVLEVSNAESLMEIDTMLYGNTDTI